MDPDTKHARPRIWLALIVAGLVSAMAVWVATSSTHARAGGGAGFTYKVIKFDYNARGTVGASRESVNCVAGVSEDIAGNGTASPSELATLGDLGEAELDIDSDGSRGEVNAETLFDYTYTGSHRETTACEDGQPASSTTSNCSDKITSTTHAYGLIKGGVGNQVRIIWSFSQDVAGTWLPNFTCVKTINFLSKEECRTPKMDLELLTRKTTKLRFICEVPLTTSPPAGTGYDNYEGFSQVSGFVKLKRTKS